MPTVENFGPWRFFYYPADGVEPHHIHVERDSWEAKFWLQPVSLAYNRGFPQAELNKIERRVVNMAPDYIAHWDDFFHS